jgi:hypothetical protein
MNPADYPSNWREVSLAIRRRAFHRCECAGECGKHSGTCGAINGQLHPRTGSRVVLTVMHLWRGPCREHHEAGIKCDDPTHLKAACQACHLAYDLPHHIARRKRRRFERKAVGELFSDHPDGSDERGAP